MLKTVSSITNAIGALNYKGTWDASTNTPNLSTIGAQKGDYYVVSVAGSTSLGGITTWYVGDWAVYNGSAWQRVEGGADDPAPSLRSNSTTGLMQVTGPAAGQTRVVTIPDANATMARTDAAQTFASVQTFAEILTGKVNSGEGDSGTIANTATATIITLPSVGVYLVTARQAGGANGGIRAAAIVAQGSSSNALTSLASAGGAALASGSGFDVNFTNNAGGDLVVRWSYTRLSA